MLLFLRSEGRTGIGRQVPVVPRTAELPPGLTSPHDEPWWPPSWRIVGDLTCKRGFKALLTLAGYEVDVA